MKADTVTDVKPLNGRQLRFADEYLIDFNATRAAKAAGYSDKTAYSQGQRLLKHVEIREAIRARKAEQDAEYEHRIMGKYEVLARLTEIAKGDIGMLPTEDETGKPLNDREMLKKAHDLGMSHLVKKIKTETVVTYADDERTETFKSELELYSAHEALRDLGKHHILFTDRIEASGADGGPVLIKVVYDEAKS